MTTTTMLMMSSPPEYLHVQPEDFSSDGDGDVGRKRQIIRPATKRKSGMAGLTARDIIIPQKIR